MTIYTSNLIINGTISNFPALYTNNITAGSFSNISVNSDLNVIGSVYSTKHMDVGDTFFATFRFSSNLVLPPGGGEASATSSNIGMDRTASDMTPMSNIPMSIAPHQVFNSATGVVTVPTSGLYNLSMQGSFSNSVVGALNGVYFKFLNHSFSNSRVGAVIAPGPLLHTSVTRFLLSNDRFQPCFYTSDNNASVVANGGESFVTFTLISTTTPTHSNYFRV